MAPGFPHPIREDFGSFQAKFYIGSRQNQLPMIDPKHKLHMASGRLETLGDGLFAIVMTILILELKIPDMEGHGMEGFRHALHETWRDFLCYVISFVVLGIMWFGHRMMFEYITRTDRYFIFLGIIFYMVEYFFFQQKLEVEEIMLV